MSRVRIRGPLPRPSLGSYGLLLLACALGAVAAAAAAGIPVAHDLVRAGPLLGFAVVAEAVSVRQQRSGNSFTLSTTAHVATAILCGPLPAVVVAVTAVGLVDGVRRRPWVHVVTNAGMFSVAIAAGSIAFDAAGGNHELGLDLGAATAALIGVRTLVNILAYSAAVGLAGGSSPIRRIGEDLRENVWPGLGEGSLGVLVATAVVDGRLALLPYLLPLLIAMHQAKANFERLKSETADVLETFAQVIDERDVNTARHSQRVAAYVERFVAAVGLPEREAERLVSAARFHDLGKVIVDEATLSSNRRLTEDELRAIRRHPRVSARLLWPFHFAKEIALYAELHHERHDGHGYYRVPPADVPVEAHVLIVADSFDAMTSARAYRPALSKEEAVEELLANAGTQFHPLVARAFAAVLLGEPVGGHLDRRELERLRREFSRIPVVPRPDVRALVAPAPVAVASAGLGLAFLTLPGTQAAGVGFAAAAAVAAGIWLRSAAVSATRRRRALFALADTGSVAEALRAAGRPGATAWLRHDATTGEYTPLDGGDGMAAADLEIAARSAARPTFEGAVGLPSGRHLLVSEPVAGGHRLAVAVRRAAGPADHALVATVCAEAARLGLLPRAEEEPPAATAAERLVVELCLFDPVRTASGQLVAERVVDQAVRHLEGLLDEGESLERRGDDTVAVLLPDGASERRVETLERRCEGVLSVLKLPPGVERGTPRGLRVAPGGAGLRRAA